MLPVVALFVTTFLLRSICYEFPVTPSLSRNSVTASRYSTAPANTRSRTLGHSSVQPRPPSIHRAEHGCRSPLRGPVPVQRLVCVLVRSLPVHRHRAVFPTQRRRASRKSPFRRKHSSVAPS